MRATGVVLLVLGITVGALLALFPANVSVFGTEVSCDAPVLRVMVGSSESDDFARSLEDQCVRKSWYRVIAAVVLGGGMVIAGGILLSMSNSAPGYTQHYAAAAGAGGSPPGWHTDPWNQAGWRWWDGMKWTVHTSGNPRTDTPTA